MKRDLIAYGTPFMDNLVHIDHLPTKKDEGARILQTSWQGGGKVSSALTAFGQLGGASSMLGVVGADSYGEFLLRDYARYDSTPATWSATASTPFPSSSRTR